MLVWQGWGLVVPAVPFLTLVLAQAAAEAAFGPGTSDQHAAWVVALALLPAAFALHRLGRRLNRGGRTLVDAATGETVVLRRRHSFWFVRVEHWGVVLAVAALVFLVTGLLA
jgi:hypothetical protein